MATIVSSEIVGGYYVESAETFTLDNGDVLRVTQDADSESPLDWGHDVVAYVHRSGYDMPLPDCAGSGDTIASAFAEYVHSARRGEDEDAMLARAVRYARTFYDDNRVARLVSFQGYSQGDWADIVFIGENAEAVNFVSENYAYYFRGDVWFVSSDNDAMGGIYADTAEEAARYFVAEYYEDGE